MSGNKPRTLQHKMGFDYIPEMMGRETPHLSEFTCPGCGVRMKATPHHSHHLCPDCSPDIREQWEFN
jgi:tRNA(Ile2) C34 agmatinyltransferase TiaS